MSNLELPIAVLDKLSLHFYFLLHLLKIILNFIIEFLSLNVIKRFEIWGIRNVCLVWLFLDSSINYAEIRNVLFIKLLSSHKWLPFKFKFFPIFLILLKLARIGKLHRSRLHLIGVVKWHLWCLFLLSSYKSWLLVFRKRNCHLIMDLFLRGKLVLIKIVWFLFLFFCLRIDNHLLLILIQNPKWRINLVYQFIKNSICEPAWNDIHSIFVAQMLMFNL